MGVIWVSSFATAAAQCGRLPHPIPDSVPARCDAAVETSRSAGSSIQSQSPLPPEIRDFITQRQRNSVSQSFRGSRLRGGMTSKRIVTGPVNIPLPAYRSATGHISPTPRHRCRRLISPITTGGFTQRSHSFCTQPFWVKTKPSRCSPKYSTMSFLPASLCTSTRPKRSCSMIACLICSAIGAVVIRVEVALEVQTHAGRVFVVCGNEPIVASRRPCGSLKWACCASARTSYGFSRWLSAR